MVEGFTYSKTYGTDTYRFPLNKTQSYDYWLEVEAYEEDEVWTVTYTDVYGDLCEVLGEIDKSIDIVDVLIDAKLKLYEFLTAQRDCLRKGIREKGHEDELL